MNESTTLARAQIATTALHALITAQMPCRFRAKQVKDGKWIVGWFVMHHIAKTDRHDNLKGYEEVPMLFNDAPGVRDKGTYWHAIDPSTLEVIKEQLSLFEEL